MNNTVFRVIRIGPDLVVSALTAPATAGAGAVISLTDTTRNQGEGTAEASTTRFFLSADFSLGPDDVPLGSRAAPSLAAGGSSTASTSVEIPPDTAGGTYYLLAHADADDAVVETIETNNTRFRSLMVGPDLVVSAISAPSAVGAGDTMTVTETTRNQGTTGAAASTTRFYLSDNFAVDPGDVPLGGRAVPALGAGVSDTGVTSVTLPDDTPSGTYYVLAMADGDEVVDETQESNNVRFHALSAGADLTVSSLTVPSGGEAGATVTVVDTTANLATGPAPASVTRFYLSSNIGFDPTDVPVGQRAVPALGAHASSIGVTSVLIPPGTTSGTYFLLAVADADNGVVEGNEGNNVRFALIRIGPDLTVWLAGSPFTAPAGATITVTDTTRNAGSGAAGPSTTAVYLSTNTIFDPGDLPLGGHGVPALGGGVSHFVSVGVVIPDGIAPGNYYLILRADDGQVVAETSETNNTRLRFLRITTTTP